MRIREGRVQLLRQLKQPQAMLELRRASIGRVCICAEMIARNGPDCQTLV